EHVPELLLAEMGQLIEAEERDLRPLPVVDRLLVLEVSECHARARGERPTQVRRRSRVRAQVRIELLAFIPETAFVSDLCQVAAEEHGTKAAIADVAQGLHQQGPCLAPACRPAVDRYVSR